MKQVLPILADIANGIFAVALASWLTNTEVLWWYFLIGIPLAMLPDLDALPELYRRGKVASSAEHPEDHRDGLHFPIVFILVGLMIYYFTPFWGTLFLLATLLHFVNDVYGTGWGVALLWPLTNTKFKFMSRRVNRLKSFLREDGDWVSISNNERRWRPVVAWREEELPSYIKRWGVENWIDRCYCRLTWISGVEYALFAVSLMILIYILIF